MWKILAVLLFAHPLYCDFTEEQVVAYHNASDDEVKELRSLAESGFFEGVQAILDVGCGDGQVTARLAKEHPEITFVGCDISEAMIDFASKHYPPSKYPNLTFVVKDACELGYKNTFDRVVSFSCLHWISDQKKALESIYQSLKPQGKAFFLATPKSSNNDFKAVSMKVILSFKWVSHFINFKSRHSFHSERDYKKILSEIGFTIDHLRQKNCELKFENRSTLDPFLKAILSPISHLPPQKKDVFLEDYYEQLVNHGNVDDQGVIRICFDKVEIAVSKL